MRLLDLFCGAGGAGEGYRRAGFEVVGVDIEAHEYPCGEFILADALDVLADAGFLAGFDVVHTSPPCQAYSSLAKLNAAMGRPSNHPRLLEPVRTALEAWGGTYVIENVPGAPLKHHMRLCGSSFGLRVRRHRLFESNAWLASLPCQHAGHDFVGVYGDHPETRTFHGDGYQRASRAATIAEAREAMGIDWMGWNDIRESIPPAYTAFIGVQLVEHLAVVA